jgi:hypothetical protein
MEGRMRRLRGPRAWALVLLLSATACTAEPSGHWLGEPTEVAPGVAFYQATDPTLVEPAGPVAVHLLRLDPDRVRLTSALAQDEILGAESVDAIAARYGALAAVNGGFFNDGTGEPTGLLKVAHELVSDTGRLRGAVVIKSPPDGPTELTFDQVAVRMALMFEAAGQQWSVPVNGVDTTRARGRLMLYTPAYHADTDTAANGTEWALSGDPLTVSDVRRDQGRTTIPRDGIVLSFGGLELPEALAALTPGVQVRLSATWQTVHGVPPDVLDEADHIVGGAGLIKRDGQVVANWDEIEALDPDAFIDERHPRTLIGRDRDGFIWLVVVDGRRPGHSVGMAFGDVVRLSERLALSDVLNLDGGGSSTMVVGGQIVNRPSDPSGPRTVSDAIVVTLR